MMLVEESEAEAPDSERPDQLGRGECFAPETGEGRALQPGQGGCMVSRDQLVRCHRPPPPQFLSSLRQVDQSFWQHLKEGVVLHELA